MEKTGVRRMKLEQTLNIVTIELSFRLLHEFHPFPKQKAVKNTGERHDGVTTSQPSVNI